MYYHGTKKCEKSPNAHEDKYTFWVYDKSNVRGFVAKWDTVIPAHVYCKNYVTDGPVMSWPKQYVCIGHTDKKDMLVAQHEWESLGLDRRLENYDMETIEGQIQKIETKIESLNSLPLPAPDLTIHTEMQSIKERLSIIETKLDALTRPPVSESMKEELQCLETKMKFLDKAMFWSFIILCFILYYSLYSKKPTYELEISSRDLDI